MLLNEIYYKLRLVLVIFLPAVLPEVVVASETCPPVLAIESVVVGAPFDMPTIQIPDFSNCPRFSITDFEAKPGSKTSTTKAIAAAIDAAHLADGGVVVIPPGKWLTGKIHLKSNVNLHLMQDSVLEFSGDPNDYLPVVKTTWEGMECCNYSPLIYAYGCKNIAITGSGLLTANLDVWKFWYSRPKPHMQALKRLYELSSRSVPIEQRQMVGNESHLRPQFIQFNRCENVLLEGVSIQNSPFWVIHPFMAKDVVIRNVSVCARGHNNDGVDPEMSQNVLIENCIFDQGDDAIAIKSGRNQDAWRLNTPAKNIVIRNCHVKHGHQLLAVGSELSGGVENVLVENCTLDPGLTSVGHLLYIKTNVRRGGYVKNIHMCNITAGNLRHGVLCIETNVLYQWKNLVPTIEERLTSISDIFIRDIDVRNVRYVTRVEGYDTLPVKKITVENVTTEEITDDQFLNRNVVDFISHRIEDRDTGP